MSEPNGNAAPGWYPDGQGNQRYWDGHQWTDHMAPAASGFSNDERTWAILAHVSGMFISFLGPLIIYLLAKEDQPFMKHHAAEAMNFHITVLIAYVVSAVLVLVLIGILMLIAVAIGAIVFTIMAAIAASRGEWYRYPMNIRMIPGARG